MDVPTMLSVFDAYGFETDDEMTDARKVEALNETYWDAASRESWPFLETSVTLTFDGTSGVPTNDPGDIGMVMTALRTSDGWVLEPARSDDFYENYGSNLTLVQSPFLYYFEGNATKFYPVPSSSDTVLVKYIKVPTELTATSIESAIVFPKRYHRSVLVMGTLARLAVMQDDIDLANGYERLYEKALALMIEDVFKQQSQRPDFIHAADSDNWDYS
jgi:hypothetical protein